MFELIDISYKFLFRHLAYITLTYTGELALEEIYYKCVPCKDYATSVVIFELCL